MFGFVTYPHKVTRRLFDLGWSPETLPEPSNAWLSLIHALRKNGVPAEQAADWLDLALQGDRPALETIDRYSGVYGMMFFGTPKMWDEHPEMFRTK